MAKEIKNQKATELVEKTSDGWNIDPITKVPLTGKEDRVLINPKTGTEFKTPRIKASDGSIIPIAYRLWTKEERDRNRAPRSGTGTSSKKSEDIKKEIKMFEDLEAFLTDKLSEEDMSVVQEMISVLKPQDPDKVKEAQKLDRMLEKMTPELIDMLKLRIGA